jgi:plasmid replication initiation protein
MKKNEKTEPQKLRDETDFFVCDVFDAPPKDDIASMEHPIFSLSTKADKEIRYYEHNGYNVKITPSGIGLATIHDKDILIYCMSQIVSRINNNENHSKTVRIRARDLLMATNRGVGGRDYKLLKDAFERLRGTSITTDIETNGKRIIEGFGLIDRWKIVTEDDKIDKMIEVEITLSDWIYNSIIGREILTISREYFQIRGAHERRIYELARKFCGKQKEWRITIDNLKKKCGSQSEKKHFKYALNKISKEQTIPDYNISVDADMVTVRLKSSPKTFSTVKNNDIFLSPEVYQQARNIAPGMDVYALEREWKSWWKQNGMSPITNPEAAFLGFCRKRYTKDYGKRTLI